jgi:hypothetical protein
MPHPQQVKPSHKFDNLKVKLTCDVHVLCSFEEASICGEDSISFSTTILHRAMFEVLTPMIMKIAVLWSVTPSGLV